MLLRKIWALLQEPGTPVPPGKVLAEFGLGPGRPLYLSRRLRPEVGGIPKVTATYLNYSKGKRSPSVTLEGAGKSKLRDDSLKKHLEYFCSIF